MMDKHPMKNRGRNLRYALLMACLSSGALAHAGSHQYGPYPAQYVEECGSCHVPYPPQRMTAAGWETQMRTLGNHYGTDASLDAESAKRITAYLMANAGTKDKLAPTEATARMTKARWFAKEHGTTPPQGMSFSNCSGCHTQAERGDFEERTLKTPKGWRRGE